MFATTDLLPPDAILGLTKLAAADQREEKVDLGVGVYKTVDGATPIMHAVDMAEQTLIKQEKTKAYTPADGAPGFGEAILELVFGADSEQVSSGRTIAVQSPGGCGALRLAGEVLARNDAAGISAGAPTWANHKPLLTAAGLEVHMIPYYDTKASAIDFDAFIASVKKLGPADALLLHGACHNPTGADLSHEQIDTVIDVAAERGFLPLIDTAYHGFAADLETDAYIIREMTRRLPEVLITYSCSKNFGLYRERTGAIIFAGRNPDQAAAVKSHIINIARASYSMPPAHGGAIVSEILHSPELAQSWREELAAMNLAVRNNRKLLVDTAREAGLGNQLSYITDQNGMFSLLPLTLEDVTVLREEFAIYIVGAGRINLCGVNAGNVGYLVKSLSEVLNR
jgi:aspartate/tyrosine/aromatic aminotransferase